MFRIIRTVADLRAAVAEWRRAGERIALVPTMGALHDGHLSLVRIGKAQGARVIVTLFVNPKQFDRPEDLARYPRTEESDAALLAPLGVDALFAPALEEVYPDGFTTTVSVKGLDSGLCGARRPGHFDGVATVVTKLLLMALPDIAIFGEKDWQQLQIIRRLTRDLNIPVEIVAGPTVRAQDGLALSSRNAYLSRAERTLAPALHRTLQAVARRLAHGSAVGPALADGIAQIKAAGFADVDYLELRAAESLEPLGRVDQPARLLAAAWLGKARLIDNVPVEPAEAALNAA